MIPVPTSHRLLSRFIGILCYSQASSLLIRTLFSLIELFLWSYNFLGGVFYLYDKLELQTRETATQDLYWGDISNPLLCWMKQTKIMKIKAIKKRKNTRPGVKMKNKSGFPLCRLVNNWIPRGPPPPPPYIILRTELNVINGQRKTGRIYLFVYLFIFTIITILKKTREKIHLNKTQKGRTKVCPYENTQILTM